MQRLEVSGAVRHIYIYMYIYVIRRRRVKDEGSSTTLALLVPLIRLRIWETLTGYQRAYLSRAIHIV